MRQSMGWGHQQFPSVYLQKRAVRDSSGHKIPGVVAPSPALPLPWLPRPYSLSLSLIMRSRQGNHLPEWRFWITRTSDPFDSAGGRKIRLSSFRVATVTLSSRQ
ncbi:hypothetical protein EJB05_30739, partial [Eragrostis curvula]